LGGNGNSPASDSGVIDYTHTFSPRLLNEVRFGFSRNKTFITVQDSGFNAATIFVDSSGQPLPGIVDGSKISSIPAFRRSDHWFRPLGSTSNLPQGRITNTYEIFDNMSLIAPFGASRHSWRWGVHARREDARGSWMDLPAVSLASPTSLILPPAGSIPQHYSLALPLPIGSGIPGIFIGRITTR